MKKATIMRASFERCAPLAVLLLAMLLEAQVPPQINYQGRVSNGGTDFGGRGLFKFALVSSNGNATFWSNDGSSSGGAAPTTAVTNPVTNGLFTVLLGDTALSNMQAIPWTMFTNPDVRCVFGSATERTTSRGYCPING